MTISTETMPAITVELQAPDIEPYRRSNSGTEFVHVLESAKPGPQVMVIALTHGNEICGAIALDRFLRSGARPARGRLTLAFANVEAFGRFDPVNPYASRFVDEDFNRVWTREVLDGPRDSVELRRARALRPFVESSDYLLDIHSMLEPSPPVMICGALEKGIRLAFDVGVPQDIVSDTGHANGTRMRDYDGFGDPASPRNALLVECGQHWEKSSERIAWQTLWRFLRTLESVDRAAADREIEPASGPPRLIRVTDAVIAKSPAFRFARSFTGLEVVPNEGDVIAWDGDQPVRAPYDNCVLIMPVPNNVKTGLTAVRLGREERR
ncbi:MAG: succinylglutamate desuccinylase/aspartoacylase family protein [Burkholderiales bacterium]|nr:succinylglutamate desuccinylase/aspartoacylase family protein [Burkholderiales bacterium]